VGVNSKAVELAEEQTYFDTAQKHRERMKAEAGNAPDAAANSGAAGWLRKWMQRRRDSVGGPDDAVGPNANVIVIYPEIPDLAGILQQDPGPHEPVELDLGPATAARLARDPGALRFRYGDAP